MESDDPVDDGRLPRVRHDDLVAWTDDAGSESPGIAAEVALGAHDELHGQPEGRGVLRSGRGPVLEALKEGRAMPPRHVRGRRGDVVASDGTHGDRRDLVESEARSGSLDLSGDLLEGRMLVADEVHLVDRDDDALHAHERAHREVPERLRAHAARCIDQQHGDVGIRGRDGHVARVLLVAGSIGDDHAPAAGQVHVAVGDVDGDALLALGFEAVGEQGEVDLTHRDRRPSAPGLPCVLELVFRDRSGLGKETADEGRLAIIHGAARDQSDHGSDVDPCRAFQERGHQK